MKESDPVSQIPVAQRHAYARWGSEGPPFLYKGKSQKVRDSEGKPIGEISIILDLRDDFTMT